MLQDDEQAGFDALARRIRIENHERTLAIVNGAELEELLGELLLAFMANDKEAEKTVKRYNFYTRIQIAYCLGLISRDEYSDLQTIKEIRNHFAHSSNNPKGSTFEDKELLDLCKQLRIPQQRPDLFDGKSPSKVFDATSFVLKENLFARKWKAGKQKCLIPHEIDSKDWEPYF